MKTYLKPSIETFDLCSQVAFAAYGGELLGDAEGWSNLSLVPSGLTSQFE